jgi:hypothetical protein
MWDNNVGAVPVVDLAGVITNRVPPEKELEHALFGSVMDKVVRKASCPVLVVPQRISRAAERIPTKLSSTR